MFLRKALTNNKDPSTIYGAIEDVDQFFREIDITSDGEQVTQMMAERLSPIAAAHRIYTNALSSMPFMVRQKAGKERLEPDHDLNYVLKVRSNELMSPFLVRKITASQAFWYGAGFTYIQRDRVTGRVEQLIPLPSAGYQRYVDEQTGRIWYSFSVDSNTADRERLSRKFESSELLIYFFETYDGIKGKGILDIARETIATDKAAQLYAGKFYRNGARVSGIIEVNGELNEANRDIVRADFERMASGMDNAFRTAVLDLGMKYTPLGTNQKDSQFIESRAFGVEETCRFTGIPAYMLQTGKQSYQSNEQQQLDFVTNTLMAPIQQIEQEWTYKLFKASELHIGYYLRLNVASLLRGDNESRSRFYEKMIALGIYNQDDCRAFEDMSPIPGGLGSHFWMSKNYATLEFMVNMDPNTTKTEQFK